VFFYIALFRVTIDGKEYKAQVVMQVLIKPNAYSVGRQTVGAKTQIDPRFSNDEMEWSTKRRGAVILYGLLVRVMEE
jgi:neuralized-like protein 4